MRPFIVPGMSERRWVAGVGRRVIVDEGCVRWRPPWLDRYQPAVDLVERQCRRMPLGEVQPPTGARSLATICAQRRMSGSQMIDPQVTKAMSYLGVEQSRCVVDIAFN